jgi:RND superfamily putative drug exporter
MVGLASQAQGADVTTPDARELPQGDSARKVAASLGSYPNIPPTQLFAVLPDPGTVSSDLDQALADVPEIVAIGAPKELPDGSELVGIAARTDPLSDAGGDLVGDIRDRLPPGSLVGGRAAEQVDQRASIEEHVPLALFILLVTNLLTLAVMTRSVILPMIALAMNLLTVVASLGVLTLVFDSDPLLGLLGASEQPGIDISVPVIAFAVAFGLATVYGIFLFARIRVGRSHASSEREAIIEGVASTGRLISASAVLMAIAVGAFVFSDLVIVKEFAVAIAVAVLLDATLVRALIIPATLQLMGRWAWWRPGVAGGPSSSEGS